MSIILKTENTTITLNIADYVTTNKLEEVLENKQDKLVSGQNIKTVNNQSLLGSGNIHIEELATVSWDVITNKPTTFQPSTHNHDDRYYTESEIDNLLTQKQEVLVSGSNIKTINSQSLLGSGNLVIEGVGGNVDWTNIQNKPSTYPPSSHQHNDLYYTETEIDTLLSNKSNTNHNHDDRYYTETEINNLLSYKSDTNHNHDTRYYTESEIDSLLNAKANSTHTHDDRYFTETEVTTLISQKQDLLVSGTNIKTINNQSLLGSGNITIEGWGSGTVTWDNVQNKPTTFPPSIHDHNDLYYTESEVDILLSDKANSNHTHDSRYYTESEVDSLLSNKADTNHNHDNRYYTETEVDSLLSTKSDTSHNHALASLSEKSYNSLTDKPDLSSLHSHNNKALLDTYTNPNSDISTAITNSHTHANKTDLDNYNPSSFASSNHDHDTRYYTETEVDSLLAQKQATLVSGTNIKTINNQSILGSGNLTIEGGVGLTNITIYDNGNKNTAFNFDLANGVVQKVTLTGSCAFGIADPSDTSKSHFITIFVHQDSTGGRSWTGVNGTNIDLGGIATSGLLSSTANYFDMFEFMWFNTKWRLVNAIFGRTT